MIRVNAFFTVKKGAEAEVQRLGSELVEASLKYRGCKGYDLFISATRPGLMMFWETWESNEALQEHSESKHFKLLVPLIEVLTEDGMHLNTFEF